MFVSRMFRCALTIQYFEPRNYSLMKFEAVSRICCEIKSVLITRYHNHPPTIHSSTLITLHFRLATATIAAKIFREESSLSRCKSKVYLSTARISSVPGCRPVSPPPAPPRPLSTPRPGCLPGTWRPPSPRRRGARGRPADGDGAALRSRYLSIYIYLYLSTRYLGRHRPLLPIPEEEVRCGVGEAHRCPEPHEVAAADPLQGGGGGRHRAFRGASTS